MSINLCMANYADFKAAANAIPSKGMVFYYTNGGGSGSPFGASFVSNDGLFLVLFDSSAAIPGGFSTDFPSAIQIGMVNGFGRPAMGTQTWNFFAG